MHKMQGMEVELQMFACTNTWMALFTRMPLTNNLVALMIFNLYTCLERACVDMRENMFRGHVNRHELWAGG